jgi:hypothetical protein
VAVRIGLVLSAAVVVAGITYTIWGMSQTPQGSTLDLLFPFVATVYGAFALVAIWVGVVVVEIVTKASRSIKRQRQPD